MQEKLRVLHHHLKADSRIVLHCANIPNFCIHSSVEEHLVYFQLLAIINKAAMNIEEHVSLLQVGASSGYMPRSGISGSSGRTMSNYLRNRQTDFQSGCTS